MSESDIPSKQDDKPASTQSIEETAPQAQSTPPSFNDLILRILADTNHTCEEKKILLNELRKSGGVDRWTFRSAIWILGGVVLLSLIAIWALSYSIADGTKIPQGLIAIGSGAVGGLAGLLTPGRERSDSN